MPIEGCERRADGGQGFCSKHYQRLIRNGDTTARIGRESTGAFFLTHGDDVSYEAVHYRVRRLRGKASDHQCTDCGSQARHWSYDHDSDLERYAQGKGAYSIEIDHYSPRCVPCHKTFDLGLLRAG